MSHPEPNVRNVSPISRIPLLIYTSPKSLMKRPCVSFNIPQLPSGARPRYVSPKTRNTCSTSPPYTERELRAEPTNDLEYEKLRRTLSCRRLTDFVQNTIFAAGNMDIIPVDPDLPECLPDGVSSSEEYVRVQIEETLSVLNPS